MVYFEAKNKKKSQSLVCCGNFPYVHAGDSTRGRVTEVNGGALVMTFRDIEMVVRTMVSVALAVIVTMMVTSLKGAMLGENVVMGG